MGVRHGGERDLVDGGDCLIFPPTADTRPASIHGYGHYHESWEFEDGQWRIAKLELRRTILEITPKERVQ